MTLAALAVEFYCRLLAIGVGPLEANHVTEVYYDPQPLAEIKYVQPTYL